MDLSDDLETLKFSQETEAMIDRFATEAERGEMNEGSLQPPDDRSPEKLVDFLLAHNEILGPGDHMPAAALEKKLQSLATNPKAMVYLKPGYTIVPVPIAFTETHDVFVPADVEQGNHVRWVVKDENGVTIRGFGFSPSFVGDFTPAEIQAHAFQVTSTDLTTLQEQHRVSFEAVQQIMNRILQ